MKTSSIVFIIIIFIVFLMSTILKEENLLVLGTFLLGVFTILHYEGMEDDDNEPPTQFNSI